MDEDRKLQVLTVWLKKSGANQGEIYLGRKQEQVDSTLERCGWELVGEIYTTISKTELEAGISYQLQKETQRLSEKLGMIQKIVNGC